MKPVCTKCNTEMRMITLGATVLYNRKVKVQNPDGLRGLQTTQAPYKAHTSDKYECQNCGATVAIVNPRPFWEHFMADDVPTTPIIVNEV